MNKVINCFVNNKKFFIFLFPIPLLINLILNLLNAEFFFGFQNTSLNQEVISLFLSALLFLFYIQFGKLLKLVFKTKYIVTSISIFWILIFAIDNLFIFLTKLITFQNYIYLCFFIFLILFTYKFSQYRHILITSSIVIFLRLIFNLLNSKFSNLNVNFNSLFTSDEQRLWYPAIESIYNFNYFEILTNNPYPGYGLLTPYIGAFNNLILTGNVNFEYFLAINYLYIFLFFYFIYEISERNTTLIFVSSIFITILLSSHWFTYVFFGSLLSEGISSFCFGVIFTEIANKKTSFLNKNIDILVLISFGFLYYSRQFISTLVLIYLLYKTLTVKNNLYLVGFFPVILKFLQTKFLPNNYFDPYVSVDLFSNWYLNFYNIYKFFVQFFIDKPVTYLYLYFLLLIFLLRSQQIKYFDFHFINFLNFILVILLMIFFWHKSDVQSSYRYFLNTFYLMLYPLCSMIDSQINSTNNKN